MSYPSRKGLGNRPAPVCPHSYLDGMGTCLDCGVFVAAPPGDTLCAHCYTEPAREDSIYCSDLCAADACRVSHGDAPWEV